jgi:hypothetical protein
VDLDAQPAAHSEKQVMVVLRFYSISGDFGKHLEVVVVEQKVTAKLLCFRQLDREETSQFQMAP